VSGKPRGDNEPETSQNDLGETSTDKDDQRASDDLDVLLMLDWLLNHNWPLGGNGR
jgi:hypothetical protein